MSCFACIFVPDFPAESIIRMEPELRALPVAVLAGKAPLEKVFAMNENARALGVEPGMTKTQLDAWANLVLRPRSELQEKGAHQALLDCAQSFSPSFEDTALDTILIDLDGLEHLFGTPSQIARQIAHRVSVLGLDAHVAAAFNPDTAMLAARGFPGVTFIPEGSEAKRLGELSVHVLFEGLLSAEQQKETGKILEIFDRWGLRNLRSLAALPEIPLVERAGQEGFRLQQLARGSHHRTLKLVQPSLTFEESVELEFPIVLLEPLAFVLNRLLEQLCNRLAARALAAQELRLHFELASEFRTEEEESQDSVSQKSALQNIESSSVHATRSTTFTRTLRLPVPMLDARIFLKLLQLDLRAHPPGAPIMKIHLTIEPAQARPAQGGLFLPPSPEPEKLELTLARIAGIVGEGNVGAVELSDTHRPESFQMKHFAPKEQDSLKTTNRTPKAENSNSTVTNSPSTAILLGGEPTATSVINSQEAPVTALRIFRPPLRAEVTILEGTPVRIACPKKKDVCGEIIWTAGPWRSSGDWWEQEGWSRDEWDIMLQNETGIALYRLVRDHFSARWAVEGSYD